MPDLKSAPYKLVDAFLQVPPLPGRRPVGRIDPNIDKWFKPGEQVRHGFTVDDLVQDIRLIEGWIANTYDMRRNR